MEIAKIIKSEYEICTMSFSNYLLLPILIHLNSQIIIFKMILFIYF